MYLLRKWWFFRKFQTRLLNNYWSHDDIIYISVWRNLSRYQIKKNQRSGFTGNWDIRPERQAPKGLNSYFLFLHLDWRSRGVLLPLTEWIFHGHETTQLLNNYWRYDNEIYTIMWSNLSRFQPEKNELSSFTGYWDIRPERQAPKGLNSYFFHLVLFYFFFLKIGVVVHHITGRRYQAIKLIFCVHIGEWISFQGTPNGNIRSRGFGKRGYKPKIYFIEFLGLDKKY